MRRNRRRQSPVQDGDSGHDRQRLQVLHRIHPGEVQGGARIRSWLRQGLCAGQQRVPADRKSTRLNSSHLVISYAVFCLKKKSEPEITSAPTWSSPASSARATASAGGVGSSQRVAERGNARARERVRLSVCFFFFNDAGPHLVLPFPPPVPLPP